MTGEKQVDKGISDIVGALADPIIVFPGGWGETLPEWLKNAITLERLLENMKALNGGEPTGTDAEACAYLMTASLTQPIDSDWAQIYFFVATRAFKRWGKGEMPEDIRVESLNPQQEQDLKRLKSWLYRERVQARKDRGRAQRREEKEKAAAENKVLQPSLFKL